ncbi:MAG: L-histidine N(alpha)-methyltransferase [candidate division NC10 bacterium]|nr:L-histidine N(alpha)-methyltransferase [candidate division NC10 bacterium]
MAPQPWEGKVHIGSTSRDGGPFARLAEDVRRGLTRIPKELPPKYFYDTRGSELFEQICELPEYYLTRTERAVLARIAGEVVASVRPTTLVEFGSGSGRKTRVLLDAMARRELLDCYVPIDLNEDVLRQVAHTLSESYPGLRTHAVIGDFEQPIEILPTGGPRLVAFLGSTIGNLTHDGAIGFLRNVARLLAPEDRFLLGTDLVKDVRVLERAYNDAAGVTAAFNRNILSVINKHLDGHFEPNRFEHLAFYNKEDSRIEMHLVARQSHQVSIDAIDFTVEFARGESIRTEISCKYTRAMVEGMLAEAGLRLVRWDTDRDRLFALSLSTLLH